MKVGVIHDQLRHIGIAGSREGDGVNRAVLTHINIFCPANQAFDNAIQWPCLNIIGKAGCSAAVVAKIECAHIGIDSQFLDFV